MRYDTDASSFLEGKDCACVGHNSGMNIAAFLYAVIRRYFMKGAGRRCSAAGVIGRRKESLAGRGERGRGEGGVAW